jgi:hypothetical protein
MLVAPFKRSEIGARGTKRGGDVPVVGIVVVADSLPAAVGYRSNLVPTS